MPGVGSRLEAILQIIVHFCSLASCVCSHLLRAEVQSYVIASIKTVVARQIANWEIQNACKQTGALPRRPTNWLAGCLAGLHSRTNKYCLQKYAAVDDMVRRNGRTPHIRTSSRLTTSERYCLIKLSRGSG